MSEETEKLKSEVKTHLAEMEEEYRRWAELNEKVWSEACGHCATCKFWDDGSIRMELSKTPRSFCRYYPASPELSDVRDLKPTQLCDWCGHYLFFADGEGV